MMEESSEKRREKLRAIREEALAGAAAEAGGKGGGGGGRGGRGRGREEEGEEDGAQLSPLGTPPSLLSEPQLPDEPEPTPRFDYYTDPLAAFTGSHKKKFRGSPAPSHASASSRSSGVPSAYHGSPSLYSTPRQLWQPSFYTPPGSYPRPNPSYYSGSGFGSPQPSSAPHSYNSAAFCTPSLPAHEPVTSPSQRTGVNDKKYNESNTRTPGSSPGMRGSSWTGLNRSPGGRGSPGGNRNNRYSGGFGSKNFQKLHRTGNASARDHPDLFVNKSMLIDPWKDLVPVRLDVDAFRVDNSSQPSVLNAQQEWLPKSISTPKPKSTEIKLKTGPSGPSLAESLAASLADAVSGEDVRHSVNTT